MSSNVTSSYKAGIFGLLTELESAKLVLIPVPWDATTSYGGGAAQGPEAILKASVQVDLFDADLGPIYEAGFHMLASPIDLSELNKKLRLLALEVREQLEENDRLDHHAQAHLSHINSGCERMSHWVYAQAKALLSQGKSVGLIGGDHSTPEGSIRAHSEHFGGDFSILHIDAHADLRKAYQGFERSHASIMYNVMHSDWRPKALVQVGVRDFCEEEFKLIQSRSDITTYFDHELKRKLFSGMTWDGLCRNIIDTLSDKVYVSFDVDGLSPEFCPNTGTPVPGGLSFDQAQHLLWTLHQSGRKIVGFDVNEVAPGEQGEFDANVGARLVYRLCGLTANGRS